MIEADCSPGQEKTSIGTRASSLCCAWLVDVRWVIFGLGFGFSHKSLGVE